jgi:hypothetical protein
MTQIKHLIPKPLPIGDAAVDGLINGVFAGGVMAVFLAVAGLLGGESPLFVLGRFDSSGQGQPLMGAVMHLAAAGVYGTLFGVLWRLIPTRVRAGAAAMSIGAAYGMGLFLIAETVILPGSRSPLLAVPIWQFAMAHLIYGSTLGWLLNRMMANPR